MKTPLSKKSSINEIKARFDADVERFSKPDRPPLTPLSWS